MSAAATEKTTRVDELIRADRRITLQNIIHDIGIDKNGVCYIIKDLAYSKVCLQYDLAYSFKENKTLKRTENEKVV